MAALALVGAVITSCSNDDNFDNQQPADNVVTVKTTVSLDDGATTRALTIDETNDKVEKTFKKGDKIKVEYYNGNPSANDVVDSSELDDSDISADGKTATFTVTLTNPQDGGYLNYVYPYRAGITGWDTQDGTWASLESKYDIASCASTMTVSGGTVTLPNLTLKNEMAILAIKLLNSNGTSVITKTISEIIIYDVEGNPSSSPYENKWSYNVTSSSTSFSNDVIYVAIRPTYGVRTNPYIKVEAFISGNLTYSKIIAEKTFKAGHFYNLGWRMNE